MTAKAALCQLLLEGRVLNVKNCFTLIGLTNCAREVSRMIEQPFSVVVSRTNMQGKSRYEQPVVWVNYRLNKTEQNLDGIEKMREYILSQANGKPIQSKPITVKEHTRKKASDTVEGDKVNNLKLFDL